MKFDLLKFLVRCHFSNTIIRALLFPEPLQWLQLLENVKPQPKEILQGEERRESPLPF